MRCPGTTTSPCDGSSASKHSSRGALLSFGTLVRDLLPHRVNPLATSSGSGSAECRSRSSAVQVLRDRAARRRLDDLVVTEPTSSAPAGCRPAGRSDGPRGPSPGPVRRAGPSRRCGRRGSPSSSAPATAARSGPGEGRSAPAVRRPAGTCRSGDPARRSRPGVRRIPCAVPLARPRELATSTQPRRPVPPASSRGTAAARSIDCTEPGLADPYLPAPPLRGGQVQVRRDLAAQ